MSRQINATRQLKPRVPPHWTSSNATRSRDDHSNESERGENLEQKSSKQRTNPSKNRLAEFFSPLLARESPYLDLECAYKSILAAREKRKYDGSNQKSLYWNWKTRTCFIGFDHRHKRFPYQNKERRSLGTKENKLGVYIFYTIITNHLLEKTSTFFYENHAKKLKISVIKIHSGNRENRAISIRCRGIQIQSFCSF